MAKAAKPRKKARKRGNGLTINVKTLCKDYTSLRVSDETYREMKSYMGDVLLQKIVRMSEKFARFEKRSTIQERDFIRARDFINYFVNKVDEYEPKNKV